ncbi:MAG: P83/100 family protein [Spirochaetales bacterium]|nr:P83/100 family protein [Spirochaetales bacterium]
MRKIAKFCICAAAALTVTANLSAIDVNKPELESAGSLDTIKFENYTGPHSVIESISAIKSIGSGLGNQVAADVNKSGTFSPGAKYTVIHAVDDTKGKLDADIIIVGENATVDHIDNLRRIIAAYLSSAYGYSESDASTIAAFVTVYNAVYRGKTDIFSSRYKDIVMANLTAEKCGLSTKWSDWAGKSQIVIPLGDLQGGLSTVDTSVISDKTVVQSMQEEDDKGVDERKNMVDIKEREAEAASEKAQESAKKAAEENKKLAEQKEVQKQAEQKAEEAKKEAQTAQKEAEADPENKEKQQIAQEKQEEAQEAQEEAQAEQEKTQEQQQVVEEARQEAEVNQAIADKKAAEAQEERSEIARDQQQIIQEQIAEASNQNTVIGLKITDSASQLSAMVKVDTVNGEVIRQSPVTVIRGRTILPIENAQIDNADVDNSLLYIAICGENTANGAIKLCLLDAVKMEIQKETNETVAQDSVLVNNGSDYYCVITENGGNYLAKFDKSLNLLLKSNVNLTSGTPVTVTPKGIVVTDVQGNTTLLKLEDLSSLTPQSYYSSTGFEK